MKQNLCCFVVLSVCFGVIFCVSVYARDTPIFTPPNIATTAPSAPASRLRGTTASEFPGRMPGDPSGVACSDEDDNDPMLACMPNPEALARLVKYADRLPGAAALIAAASILAKELIELASGDAGALDPRSSMAMLLLGLVAWRLLATSPPPATAQKAPNPDPNPAGAVNARAEHGVLTSGVHYFFN